MNILRQNSDCALRLMANLAARHDRQPVSVRILAQAEDISHQFACKILQKLHAAALLESVMGPTGGYRLACSPATISMLDVVNAMQGAIIVNRCTDSQDDCPRQADCPVSPKLCRLQQQVEKFFADVTLQDLL